MHPGLPEVWAYVIWGFMLLVSGWFLVAKSPADISLKYINLANLSFLQPLVKLLKSSKGLLLFLKIISVSLFILVIVAGLQGTPIPERNIATVLTWNIWWAGLIVSIFFLGSSWCAICPWDALASWFVKPRIWFVGKVNNSLELTLPKWLRNVMPALLMFIGLTWLELGVGVTTSPYGTAVLSLLMVVMALKIKLSVTICVRSAGQWVFILSWHRWSYVQSIQMSVQTATLWSVLTVTNPLKPARLS